MLIDLFPRAHARFAALPLLGPQLDRFVRWLDELGFARIPIRRRIRKTPRLDNLLHCGGVRELSKLSTAELLSFAPRRCYDDAYLSALVRSLAAYLEERGTLATPSATPSERMVGAYRDYLDQVRGLAALTVQQHATSASELLGFLHFDDDPTVLPKLTASPLERFVKSVAARLSRVTLQHKAAHLRSFLRFLAGRGEVAPGLDAAIEQPRVYRSEQLPRALPWESVQTLLATVDRTTAMGRRDYAMLLLIATYGLRASEVAAVRLDHIAWRAGHFQVPRPKTQTPIVLPLTLEVGAALLDYLRHARPASAHREVFLRVRKPGGPLVAAGVGKAFRVWGSRSALNIRSGGAHCLRHSLALHLLRQGTSLKAIGDLLGHRSMESTCVYLRLHVDDLRAAALDLPAETEAQR